MNYVSNRIISLKKLMKSLPLSAVRIYGSIELLLCQPGKSAERNLRLFFFSSINDEK